MIQEGQTVPEQPGARAHGTLMHDPAISVEGTGFYL